MRGLLLAARQLLRKAVDALFRPDELDCYGCHLDGQWVGSEPADHSCERLGVTHAEGSWEE